jgi:pimeloyl-ACP methyl ester carboxylesterase
MANDAAVATLPPLKTARANGRAISYLEAGSGPALMLLHGIGSGSASWEYQLALPGYRVIAWDAPGYGGSDPLPDAKPKTKDYADSLAAFLDALGVQKAHVVGHSLGGLMAGSFARHYPDRVLSLTLAAPAGGYGTASAELREQKLRERLDVLDSLGPQGMAEKRSHVLVSPNASPEALAKVRAVHATIKPDGYRQAVYMLNGGDLRGDGAQIRARTTVVCGSADVVTPEKGCMLIAESIRGARYVSLPGLGHCLNVEGPAAFNRVLSEFLAAA